MTSYNIIHRVVKTKIDILIEEPTLIEQKASILLHYTKRTIDKTMKRIISEHPDYYIRYQWEINVLDLHITRK